MRSMRHYATYFDHRFLARGLALLASLRRCERAFTFTVLALDEQAHRAMLAHVSDTVRVITLGDLERAYPALREVRPTRTTVEYYFTCTPALPLYLMDHHELVRTGDTVCYVDADLYFFQYPQPLFDEFNAAGGSTLIIEHRYTSELAERFADHGRFNVGLVAFRNDLPGRACVTRWHTDCLDWCYDKLEDGKYADQGYLDRWPALHEGVVVAQHRGANAAPWNLTTYPITFDGDVCIGGDPLLFFHFHRLRVIRPHLFDVGLHRYGAALDKVVREQIYAPYLRELSRLSTGGEGSLRLAEAATRRELVRQILYGHSVLQLGPITRPVHAEPWARPLLKLRDAVLGKAGRRAA